MGGPYQNAKSTFLALVESGRIRYQTLPVNGVAIADDGAWDQLFAAAGAPAVDYWLCGFAHNVATGLLLAEDQLLIDVGWGGLDGAAVAAANVIVTNWPINFTAVALALGPTSVPNQLLPYPVKIPAASRMAARIATSPVGGVAVTGFCAILATAIGT